jgi:hypothetical protein
MKIETHIPLPTSGQTRRGKTPTYPFGELPVGGSFAVRPALAEKAATAARAWKRRHPGWDYVTRKTEAEFRVWRSG